MTNEISTQEETGLLEVQKLQEIVATAPEILQLNIASKTKAIEAGQKLVDAAKLGMSDFQDEQLSIFMTKAKKTIDSMNERRKPFTQIVDAVKKQFTALESDLKPIMEEIQGYRNSYATQKMLAKQEADRVALLQLNKEKELICDIIYRQELLNILGIEEYNIKTIDKALNDIYNKIINK